MVVKKVFIFKQNMYFYILCSWMYFLIFLKIDIYVESLTLITINTDFQSNDLISYISELFT